MLSCLNRRDWILIAVNLAGAAINLAWALAFPDNVAAPLNWIAVGGCTAMAFTQPILAQWRHVVEDMTATVLASSKAIEAMSPVQMRTMLQGALSAVVEEMKRDGTLPHEINVQLAMPDKTVH